MAASGGRSAKGPRPAAVPATAMVATIDIAATTPRRPRRIAAQRSGSATTSGWRSARSAVPSRRTRNNSAASAAVTATIPAPSSTPGRPTAPSPGSLCARSSGGATMSRPTTLLVVQGIQAEEISAARMSPPSARTATPPSPSTSPAAPPRRRSSDTPRTCARSGRSPASLRRAAAAARALAVWTSVRPAATPADRERTTTLIRKADPARAGHSAAPPSRRAATPKPSGGHANIAYGRSGDSARASRAEAV